MKFRTPFAALVVSAFMLLASAGHAFAAVLVSQLPNGDTTISQEFPDAPTFSTYAFDDFTLLQAQSLTSLRAFGTDLGMASQNVAVTAQIWSGLPGSGSLLQTFSGTEDALGTLIFDLGGFQLDAGTYWLTAFVTRTSPSAGTPQRGADLSMPVNGSEAYLYNPGGDLLGTTSPVPISEVGYPPSDLAFILEGNAVTTRVPEPASLALFGAALAALGLARRRRPR